MTLTTDTPTAAHTCDDGGFIYHRSCAACRELRIELDVTYCVHCARKGTLSGRLTREQLRENRGRLPIDQLAAQYDLDSLQSRCMDENACYHRARATFKGAFSYAPHSDTRHPGAGYALAQMREVVL